MSKKRKKKKRELEKVSHKEFVEPYELSDTEIFTVSKPKKCKIDKHEFHTIKGAELGILTTSSFGASVALLIVVLAKVVIALLRESGETFDKAQFKFDLWAFGISALLTICCIGYEKKYPDDRRELINKIKKFFDD